jgi:hypothetical protein
MKCESTANMHSISPDFDLLSARAKGVGDVLRVDKKSRTFGPEDQKTEYHKRPPIEAVNSFLKTQYNMAMNKVRGLLISNSISVSVDFMILDVLFISNGVKARQSV